MYGREGFFNLYLDKQGRKTNNMSSRMIAMLNIWEVLVLRRNSGKWKRYSEIPKMLEGKWIKSFFVLSSHRSRPVFFLVKRWIPVTNSSFRINQRNFQNFWISEKTFLSTSQQNLSNASKILNLLLIYARSFKNYQAPKF